MEGHSAEAVAAAPGKVIGGTETVLLVEDEVALRGMVREILEGQGYRVLEVTAPEAALALPDRQKSQIDLLLTDVVMPGMSGVELAERLKPAHRGMKVLFMSGYTDDGVVRQGTVSPGSAFIQKPFKPEALLRKVRRILDSADQI